MSIKIYTMDELWETQDFDHNHQWVEYSAYREMLTENIAVLRENKIMREALDALKAKHEELLSYLPRVPTQPYEKELAKHNLIMHDMLVNITKPNTIPEFEAAVQIARDYVGSTEPITKRGDE